MAHHISTWQSEDRSRQVVPRIVPALAIGTLLVAVFWAEKWFVDWYMGEMGQAIESLFGIFR